MGFNSVFKGLILLVFTALTVRTAIFYDVAPYFGSSAQDYVA